MSQSHAPLSTRARAGRSTSPRNSLRPAWWSLNGVPKRKRTAPLYTVVFKRREKGRSRLSVGSRAFEAITASYPDSSTSSIGPT